MFLENLLQSSVDESWPTDTNLNRVSVIQFQDQAKPDEEDDETAAEKKVSLCVCVCRLLLKAYLVRYTMHAGSFRFLFCFKPAGSAETSDPSPQRAESDEERDRGQKERGLYC